MNLRKAATAALRPAYWPALARLVLPSIEHAPAFDGIEPNTVIDVGANKGQFAAFAAVRWPKAQIFSFEPLNRPCATFRHILGNRATLFECAVGEEPATLDIHIASRRDSSSLLPLGNLQKKLFAMEEVATRPVPVQRLDDTLRDRDLQQPILLKIDVQGFEHQVLRGIGVLKEEISWIYVEVSFAELYLRQKLFPEVEALLKDMDFVHVRSLNEVYDQGRLVQADALFRKVRPSG